MTIRPWKRGGRRSGPLTASVSLTQDGPVRNPIYEPSGGCHAFE
jgi:hypothetical protein